MGSFIGKTMDESMQKNQQAMQESQKVMLERQIEMQNMMREKAAAMQLARATDMFNWWMAAYTTFLVAGIAGFKRVGHPGPLIPVLPLTFIVGYQADLVYGNKIKRMQVEAERILNEDIDMTAVPLGLPTVDQLDERRQLKK